MKKNRSFLSLLFLSVFALVPLFSVSALPEFTMSGGGGLLLGGLFTDYIIDADENTKYGQTELTMTQEMQQFNFGGFAFFDATYGELSVTVHHGINSYEETVQVEINDLKTPSVKREGAGSETMLGFTLLGKYPFSLVEDLLLYPLAGISYRIALTEKRTPDGDKEYDRTEGGLATEFSGIEDYKLSMWNSFLINIGAGLDFYFRSPWYLRTELLYSFRLMTDYENAAIDWLVYEYDISQPGLLADPGMRGLTHGPELRVALGYRFR